MPSVDELPNGRWRVRWQDPTGKRVGPEGLTFPTRSMARAYGLDREAEIRRGEYRDPTSGRILLKDWAAEWLENRVAEPRTLSKIKGHVDRYVNEPVGEGARAIGDLRLEQLDPHVVQGWVKRLERQGLAPASIDSIYTTLATMLRAALRIRRLAYDVTDGVTLPTIPPPSDFFWEHKETAAVRAQLAVPRDLALFELLLGSGMRWGEAVGLHLPRWQPLRRRASVVEVLTEDVGVWAVKEYPKGKRRREVPVTQLVVDAMAAHLAVSPAVKCGLHVDRRTGKPKACPGLVFHEAGRPLSRHVWPRATFAAAVAAAGVRPGRVHDLRHTYASHLVIAGVPLRQVQQLLGHASIRTTERYSHLAPDANDTPQLRAALEALGGAVDDVGDEAAGSS